jgi:prepilin-type N-terminal cleavage/methylation domain-containing protein
MTHCGLGIEKCELQKADLNPKSAIRNPRSKGFTLLEVMVAVAILGMVLVTLIGVKNRSMQDVMIADRITTATLLATRKMNEILVAPSTRTTVQEEDEGEFTEEELEGRRTAGDGGAEEL